MFRKSVVGVVVLSCLAAWPAAALAGGGNHVMKRFGPGRARASATRTSRSTATAATTSRTTTSTIAYDPPTRRAARRRDDHAPRRPRTSRASTSTSRGLTVRSVTVDGRAGDVDAATAASSTVDAGARPARRPRRSRSWSPTTACRARRRRRARRSDGLHRRPTTAPVAGQPHGAATWYPVNDHPLDKATYTFRITVPAGCKAIANGDARRGEPRGAADDLDVGRDGADGVLPRDGDDRRSSTCTPTARRPAVPRRHRPGPARPRRSRAPGTQFALSQARPTRLQAAAAHDRRPGRRRAALFWVNRDTEPSWDFFFVEAHTVGAGRLDDAARPNGHTQPGHRLDLPVGARGCTRSWPTTRRDDGDGTCAPTGTTGTWKAATGASDGYEQLGGRSLAATPASTVEVSLTYASDDVFQLSGVDVDDIVVRPARRLDLVRGRRRHARRLDRPGRTGRQPPERERLDRRARPPTRRRRRRRRPGRRSRASRRSSTSSRRSSGRTRSRRSAAIVDDTAARLRAGEPDPPDLLAGVLRATAASDGDTVIVHELAHQWTATACRVDSWQRHLAQRGLRDLRRVAVERARGPGDRAGRSSTTLRDDPGRRALLDAADRRPGPDDLFDRRSTSAAR